MWRSGRGGMARWLDARHYEGFDRTIPLASVAWAARWHHVLPRVGSALAQWDNVIHRQHRLLIAVRATMLERRLNLRPLRCRQGRWLFLGHPPTCRVACV